MSTQYKSSRDVPTEVLAARLNELADVVAQKRDRIGAEFTMRIPAECDRDADLVMAEAARRLSAGPGVQTLVEALEEGLRAIGDHHAPGDCYATGPMTGDPFRDLVQCPACSFIAMCDDLLAAYREGGQR